VTRVPYHNFVCISSSHFCAAGEARGRSQIWAICRRLPESGPAPAPHPIPASGSGPAPAPAPAPTTTVAILSLAFYRCDRCNRPTERLSVGVYNSLLHQQPSESES